MDFRKSFIIELVSHSAIDRFHSSKDHLDLLSFAVLCNCFKIACHHQQAHLSTEDGIVRWCSCKQGFLAAEGKAWNKVADPVNPGTDLFNNNMEDDNMDGGIAGPSDTPTTSSELVDYGVSICDALDG